jgi:hypothetical protein
MSSEERGKGVNSGMDSSFRWNDGGKTRAFATLRMTIERDEGEGRYKFLRNARNDKGVRILRYAQNDRTELRIFHPITSGSG